MAGAAVQKPTTLLLFRLLFAAVLLSAAAEAHNITAILEGFPEYSVYNKYLTETKVADEINSRETVTCLVLPNSAMSALAANHTIAAVKNALRLLTLLDYFDPPKLHSIPSGTTLTTTLLQTTGAATGNFGFVNITNLRGGRVAFGPAAAGSKLQASYTKSIKEMPYNISVLEVSDPIVFPGLLDAPTAGNSNLTAILEKAGCKTFAGLLISSGVLKMYQSAMGQGLTVFAPSDEAFKAPGVPDVKSLTSAEIVTLLQYHALPSYTPKDSLKADATGGRIRTLASTGSGKYEFSVTARGDDVTLVTGVDSSRVASTILDATPVCVLTVDNILLPVELFGKGPSPAPGPAPLSSLSPSPAGEAPSPAGKASAPSPMPLSPPAPPTSSPGGSPAGAPDEASDQKAEDKSTAAVGVKPLEALAAAVTVYWALVSIL